MFKDSVIYGLELQGRTLTSQIGELEDVNFLIGTQSLKKGNNQVHQIKYKNSEKPLKSTVFKFEYGDIWKLSANPKNAQMVAICYGSSSETNYTIKSLIGKLAQSEETFEHFIQEELDLVDDRILNRNFITSEFNPGNEYLLASVVDRKIINWDLQNNIAISITEIESEENLKCATGKWCPSNNWNQFSVAVDDQLKSYDLRTNSNSVWSLKCQNSHSNSIRDFDFNLNKQFIVATGDDDGNLKIWDYRFPENCILNRSDHTHWIWSVKFNPFYDQLILSGGSDGKTVLSSVYSASSDFKDDYSNGIEDAVLKVNEHEESVYCVDWSTTEPWIYASLSYDGRLILDEVDKRYQCRLSN